MALWDEGRIAGFPFSLIVLRKLFVEWTRIAWLGEPLMRACALMDISGLKPEGARERSQWAAAAYLLAEIGVLGLYNNVFVIYAYI